MASINVIKANIVAVIFFLSFVSTKLSNFIFFNLQTFTGMTKEELMKYANDPFWVKLRWVLFILFWGLWMAMLAGAIAIIVYAPKCAAPTPLVWWKKGPLITVDGTESVEDIKSFNAKGVVYELSPEDTYLVDTPRVEEKIKKILEDYK